MAAAAGDALIQLTDGQALGARGLAEKLRARRLAACPDDRHRTIDVVAGQVEEQVFGEQLDAHFRVDEILQLLVLVLRLLPSSARP